MRFVARSAAQYVCREGAVDMNRVWGRGEKGVEVYEARAEEEMRHREM